MNPLNLILILLYLTTLGTGAQIVNIPDPVFKNMLVNHLCADYDGDGINESNVDLNGDGEIQESEAAPVLGLEAIVLGITSIEGIEAFTSLRLLNMGAQKLSSIDVSQNLDLRILYCDKNAISIINVSQNLVLERLVCRSNNIIDIDVSNNVNLTYLSVSVNNLTQIDISQNPLLEYLYVGGNQLTVLDISHQPLLKELNFQNNLITEIDVNAHPVLENLWAARNKLTQLDVSQNPALELLVAWDNSISTIDVSQNPYLRYLVVENNNLTTLNLRNGNNTNFYFFNALDNPDLECIQVDDVIYSNSQECSLGNSSGWCKDETATYSEFCELSISDESLESLFTIYPNPVKDLLSIQNPNGLDIESVTLYDTLGRKVFESKEINESIEVSHLSSGVYFLHITTAHGSVTQKISKE